MREFGCKLPPSLPRIAPEIDGDAGGEQQATTCGGTAGQVALTAATAITRAFWGEYSLSLWDLGVFPSFPIPPAIRRASATGHVHHTASQNTSGANQNTSQAIWWPSGAIRRAFAERAPLGAAPIRIKREPFAVAFGKRENCED